MVTHLSTKQAEHEVT